MRLGIPPVPLVLGLGGLIPFWGLAIVVLMRGAFGIEAPFADIALAAYGAIIISFLGGIRWGLAVARGEAVGNYIVSIIPSLLAWAFLALPEPWRLAALGLLVLVLGPIDLGLVRAGTAPPWFGRLRLILSAGAGVALLLGAAGIGLR